MRHHLVLVGGGVPGWDVFAQSYGAAAVQEVSSHGFAIAVCRGIGAVEPRHEIDLRNSEARVSVDSSGVEDAGGLVGTIGIGGPGIGQGYEAAGEGEVDELGNEGELGAVCGGVPVTEGGVCTGEGVGNERVEREGGN